MSKEYMIDKLISRYGFEHDIVLEFAQACYELANIAEFNAILTETFNSLMT